MRLRSAQTSSHPSYRRWVSLLVVLGGIVPALLFAGGASAKQAAFPRNQTLVVAIPQAGNYESLGWMMQADSKALWSVINDPVMGRNFKTWALDSNGLVPKWSHSKNWKVWTFHLRKGVKWQDGYGELTSADFVYTVKQIMKKTATGSAASWFQQNLKTVKAKNKFTVIMKFKTGQFQIPRQLSYAPFAITSKKYVKAVGLKKANAHPIGTGPYRYIGGTPGQEYDFEAVPHQWRVTPQFKYLRVLIQPDASTTLSGLESGAIDIAPMSGDLLKQGLSSGLKLHEQKRSAEVVLLWGGVTKKGTGDYCPQCPWVGNQADPKSAARAKMVREAMSLAIDRKAIIQAVFGGYADLTPFVFYWYPQIKGWSKKWTYGAYNPTKAKQLLDKAGYPNGFTIKLNPDSNPTIGPDLVTAVGQYWAKIGITLQQVPESFSTYVAKIAKRSTNDTGFGPLTTAYIFDDPVTAWFNTMSSKAPNGEIQAEFFDKLVAEGNAALNPKKRLRIEEKIANEVHNNYWTLNIAFASTTWLTSKRVGKWPTMAGYTYTNNLEYVKRAK